MNKNLVRTKSKSRSGIEISHRDYAAIMRCIEFHSEIKELIADKDFEAFVNDRLVSLAVLQLMRSILCNLKGLETTAGPSLKSVPWDTLRALHQTFHNQSRSLYKENWPNIWQIAHSTFPSLISPLHEVVTQIQSGQASSSDCQEFGVLHRIPEKANLSIIRSNNSLVESTVSLLPENRPLLHPPHSLKSRRFETIIANQALSSAEMVRTQKEIWYRDLAIADQESLRPRLCSADEIASTSAFYELIFHDYFKHRNISIEREPDLGVPSRPDLLVNHPDCPFVLEVTSAWTKSEQYSDAIEQSIYFECLDNITDRYLLSVHVDNHSLFGLEEFRGAVHQWITTLEPSAMAQRFFQSASYGFRGTITAHPRLGIQTRGTVYEWHPPQPKVSDTELACNRVVRKQMLFKKSWTGPIVLAVCARENTSIDKLDLCAALFGHVEIIKDKSRELPTKIIRKQKQFPLQRKTHISAILFCTRRFARTGMIYEMNVIHNPSARAPLPKSVFANLPQLLPDPSGERHTMEWLQPFTKNSAI